MIKKFAIKWLFQIIVNLGIIVLLFTSLSKAQSNSTDDAEQNSTKFDKQIFLALSNASSSLSGLDFNNRAGMSMDLVLYGH